MEKPEVTTASGCHCCSDHGVHAGNGTAAMIAGTEAVTSIFRLAGLDCADCAAHLEKRLNALPGVKSVVVNFGAAKLTISHYLTDADIIEAVRQAGYQAERYQQAASAAMQSGRWWSNPKTMATALAGIFLGAAMLLEWMDLAQTAVIPLYALAMIVGGYHVAISGLYGLKSMTMDTNFLMLIAAIGAVAIGEWSEGATVVFLFSLGNALQAYTMDKTRQSIRALMELAPRDALVRRDGQEIRLPVEEIVVGDTILVLPGERIAMDGQITAGLSSVNQAAITGESLPVEKEPGDVVYAGTVNEQGVLEVLVTKLAQDSTISRIMHMVEEAQAEKAPMQQFIDVFAKYYTPAVIAAAIGIAIVPPLVFNQPFDEWFYRSLVLLVISCPCALVISTPVSIVSAIGNASRNGVLIKGGIYLEQMGIIQAVAFDKTGTLTEGKPSVTDIIPLGGSDSDELLALAATIEQRSEHPLAKAILARAGELKLDSVADFMALPGRGAQATVQGETVYVGNMRLFADLNFPLEHARTAVSELEKQGKTVVLIGRQSQLIGLIALADTVRASAPAAIAALRKAGVKSIAMLTGDNERAAQNIAGQTGVDTVFSELMPQDKVAALQQLANKHGSVAMVGDGINDAPALAVANVGIAMGGAGSDSALETADVALMSDDLGKLAYMIGLSRKMMSIIRQNITFSLAVKALFVIGTFAGFVNLWLAVFADTGASLLVTLNGMRLVRTIK